jgi:hypothetical protein
MDSLLRRFTCRSVKWHPRQFLDGDCLVFNRLIKFLQIAGLKAAQTSRVCCIKLTLGRANRMSPRGQVLRRSLVTLGATAFVFVASLGRSPRRFSFPGHSYKLCPTAATWSRRAINNRAPMLTECLRAVSKSKAAICALPFSRSSCSRV